jgi:hypothetical protein
MNKAPGYEVVALLLHHYTMVLCRRMCLERASSCLFSRVRLDEKCCLEHVLACWDLDLPKRGVKPPTSVAGIEAARPRLGGQVFPFFVRQKEKRERVS